MLRVQAVFIGRNGEDKSGALTFRVFLHQGKVLRGIFQLLIAHALAEIIVKGLPVIEPAVAA